MYVNSHNRNLVLQALEEAVELLKSSAARLYSLLCEMQSLFYHWKWQIGTVFLR